jgi:hypothetical protein
MTSPRAWFAVSTVVGAMPTAMGVVSGRLESDKVFLQRSTRRTIVELGGRKKGKAEKE